MPRFIAESWDKVLPEANILKKNSYKSRENSIFIAFWPQKTRPGLTPERNSAINHKKFFTFIAFSAENACARPLILVPEGPFVPMGR